MLSITEQSPRLRAESPSGRADHAGQNRRRFHRDGCRVTATAVARSRHEGVVVSGVRVIDSSPAGLGLASPRPIPVGTPIDVHFEAQPLPGRSGRVTRCEKRTIPGIKPDYVVGVDCWCGYASHAESA